MVASQRSQAEAWLELRCRGDPVEREPEPSQRGRRGSLVQFAHGSDHIRRQPLPNRCANAYRGGASETGNGEHGTVLKVTTPTVSRKAPSVVAVATGAAAAQAALTECSQQCNDAARTDGQTSCASVAAWPSMCRLAGPVLLVQRAGALLLRLFDCGLAAAEAFKSLTDTAPLAAGCSWRRHSPLRQGCRQDMLPSHRRTLMGTTFAGWRNTWRPCKQRP